MTTPFDRASPVLEFLTSSIAGPGLRRAWHQCDDKEQTP
jgi:hypothetical protein